MVLDQTLPVLNRKDTNCYNGINFCNLFCFLQVITFSLTYMHLTAMQPFIHHCQLHVWEVAGY